MEEQCHRMTVSGAPIAVRHLPGPGGGSGLVWLGGYRSSMAGTKAGALAAMAAGAGLSFLRHDYSGHGQSGGDFEAGTISRWLAESLAVFDRFATGPQVLIGSSMGAWIALRMVQDLVARGTGHRIAGLLLIAPAPDFTALLRRPALTPEQEALFGIPENQAAAVIDRCKLRSVPVPGDAPDRNSRFMSFERQ